MTDCLACLLYTAGVSAIVAGFESPLAAKRSVVLLASSKPDGLDAAVAALRGGEGYDKSCLLYTSI